VFEHLADLVTELEKLEARLSEIYAGGDQAAARDAGRRHAELKPVVDTYLAYLQANADIAEASELLASEQDSDMQGYLRGEITEKEAALHRLESELKELLVPKDPNDGRNVIIEIRGAEGGEEANLWARELVQMYEGLAKRRGWKMETLATQPSDMGGLREASLVATGADAWARL
jgi:peptide chain release factor 1